MEQIFNGLACGVSSVRALRHGVVVLFTGFLLVSCTSLTSSDSARPNGYSLVELSEQYPNSPGFQVLESKEPPTIRGFRRVNLDAGTVVYVAKNAALEPFDNWQLLAPVIHSNRRFLRLTPAESNQLQRLAIYASERQIQDAGFDLVGGPSPCTLTAQLLITDLRLFKSGLSSSQYNYTNSLGSYEAIVEVRQSEANRLMAFLVSHVDMGGGVTKSSSPNMNRFLVSVADTVDKLPSVFSALELDEKNIASRTEMGCSGTVGRKWKSANEQHQSGV